jgi:hypothetical protein
MFEYQFPSPSFFSYFNPWAPNPLLKSIHIQGPFITIFGRKTVGEELSIISKELKVRVIPALGMEHHTCHNMIESPWEYLESTRHPHVHYTITDRSVEKGITDLISAIFQRHNPAVREQDHQTLLAETEKERVRLKHEELPDHIKESLAQIDTTSPFILSEDSQALIQDILSKYGEYCIRHGTDRCRELLQMYFIGPLKLVILKEDFEEVEKKRISTLLQPLLSIRQRLNTTQKEPYNAEVFQQIQNLIQEVDVNELIALENRDNNYITEEASLQERLDFISSYAQERLECIKEYKKTWRFTLDLLYSRIFQIYHSIFSSPTPRTA